MDEELSWGPTKKHNQKGNKKISEISLFCTDVSTENYLVMFVYRPKQIAQNCKTMKTKLISTCRYMQLHITRCKAFLKREAKHTLKMTTVLNESKVFKMCFFPH